MIFMFFKFFKIFKINGFQLVILFGGYVFGGQVENPINDQVAILHVKNRAAQEGAKILVERRPPRG